MRGPEAMSKDICVECSNGCDPRGALPRLLLTDGIVGLERGQTKAHFFNAATHLVC